MSELAREIAEALHAHGYLADRAAYSERDAVEEIIAVKLAALERRIAELEAIKDLAWEHVTCENEGVHIAVKLAQREAEERMRQRCIAILRVAPDGEMPVHSRLGAAEAIALIRTLPSEGE